MANRRASYRGAVIRHRTAAMAELAKRANAYPRWLADCRIVLLRELGVTP